jgi:hypothetical protein
LSGKEIDPVPFPVHLRHYVPGRMKVTDLAPNDYWQTDLIDLELGKAVQDAWNTGITDARQGHEAEQAMRKSIAERYGGGAAC